MSSSISAARLALDTLFTTAVAAEDSDLYGVQNTFGPPEENEEQEVVAILGLTDTSEETVPLGPQAKREEDYRINVAVKVYDPTSDSRTVDTRGFLLADAVRQVVNDNRTLTGTVRTAFVVQQNSDGAVQPVDANGKRLPGWVIRIDLAVRCQARV